MSRNKVTVTLDEDLLQELDRISSKSRKPRSRLVEEAIRCWQRSQRQNKLIEGYRTMASEDQKIAEANLPAAYEILK
ncbi:ribbon-helix-helix domain-containing protein [bacterium]|nr:ribbon-helix-helix domain-containing protein [bacterium]MCI0604654.1 ribbon-helix-helix domain-containing protein [bacterium]